MRQYTNKKGRINYLLSKYYFYKYVMVYESIPSTPFKAKNSYFMGKV